MYCITSYTHEREREGVLNNLVQTGYHTTKRRQGERREKHSFTDKQLQIAEREREKEGGNSTEVVCKVVDLFAGKNTVDRRTTKPPMSLLPPSKRGGPSAPPDSVDFLPRVPKSPVRPGQRVSEDQDERRERMEDPVAAGSLHTSFVSVDGEMRQRGDKEYLRTGLVKVKQCGLCTMEYEEHNLPGVVSFQAIANLRKQ